MVVLAQFPAKVCSQAASEGLSGAGRSVFKVVLSVGSFVFLLTIGRRLWFLNAWAFSKD